VRPGFGEIFKLVLGVRSVKSSLSENQLSRGSRVGRRTELVETRELLACRVVLGIELEQRAEIAVRETVDAGPQVHVGLPQTHAEVRRILPVELPVEPHGRPVLAAPAGHVGQLGAQLRVGRILPQQHAVAALRVRIVTRPGRKASELEPSFPVLRPLLEVRAEQTLGLAVAPRVAVAASRLEGSLPGAQCLELLPGELVVGVLGEDGFEPSPCRSELPGVEVGHRVGHPQIGVVRVALEAAAEPALRQVVPPAPPEHPHRFGDHGRIVFVSRKGQLVVGHSLVVASLVGERPTRRETRLGVGRVGIQNLLEPLERLALAPGPEQHPPDLELQAHVIRPLPEQRVVEGEGVVVVATPGQLACPLLIGG
jgi:hypothetical protein